MTNIDFRTLPKHRVGLIYDRVIDASTGEVVEEHWGKNVIVKGFYTLRAYMLKNCGATKYDPALGLVIETNAALHPSTLWCAIGTMPDPYSDSNPPAANENDIMLDNEVARVPVFYEDINFIDNTIDLSVAIKPSNVPTNIIKMTAVFDANLVGTIRQIGFFGGSASLTTGSGFLIDKLNHETYLKRKNYEWERSLILIL
jgi:hypothetical protein